MITRCTYYGTQMQNVPVGPLMHAFAEAIGTRMNFGALSVDKPGVAPVLLGPAGDHDARHQPPRNRARLVNVKYSLRKKKEL